jgi:hypothetical protein
MNRITLGLAIFIATASGTTAQNSSSSAIDQLSTLASEPLLGYTAAFRKQFIQTFASYCQQVLDALPANTPAEDAWVASGKRTPAQITRLLQSKEYSRHYLKNFQTARTRRRC